jgi:hypothetical protein
MCHPFERPGIYAIRAVGIVDATWSDRLGGMTIVQSGTTAEDSLPVTKLVGLLPDQAALCGVLNTLYDNRYALLGVEYLGPG